MGANTFILISLYTIPLILVLYVIRLFRMAISPGKITIFVQMRHYFEAQKKSAIDFYRRPDMVEQFEQCGLLAAGITPTKYRLIRDIIFFVLILMLNIKFLISMNPKYPFFYLVCLVFLYIALQLRKSFPITYVLKAVRKRFEQKKNAEILVLQQLISNEYADNRTTKQNVYHMFLYLRRFLNYIRPAVDRFLDEYPKDPNNKERAFKSFAHIVGTPEAKSLAQILYQIDHSSPEELAELLEKRYDELKKKRQEAYRAVMRDRGIIAYTLTFSGVMMVIICGLFVYYLEYKDMMNATYNIN